MTTEINKKALEQTAFNLCSLHDFDNDFVWQNEKFAKAVIVEYMTALHEIEPNLVDEVNRLQSKNDLLIDALIKANERNSDLVAMQCNNITATIEATEQPTLRDQFAMQALNSWLADPDAKWSEDGLETAADRAYQAADAMMVARK